MFRILVVVLLLLGFPVFGQWSGCIDPGNPGAPVTQGTPTTVCVVLGPDRDWSLGGSYLRYNFKPIADEYSRYSIPNCKYVHALCISTN
mmetsp:Transcript_2902/g.4244  ORF Transcript_2902/g.4244 Transcript_2902/m.4244 type:complete len:89 (-) Transcript_2902:643-909(-)